MNTRTVSIILITLCFLSIIIGLIGTSGKPKESKQEKVVSKFLTDGFSKSEQKIALISIQGVIAEEKSSSPFEDFGTANSALKSLEKAIDDNSVKGVILRINSPGGTVAMSQEIYEIILKLREKKPVVVSMADVAASGGYYISSAADRIYADPGTLTGSIGVIMNAMDVQGLFTDKLGIKSNVIKSGKFKDTGSMYRTMTQEERALLQNLVNSAYNQFVTAIINGRVKRSDNYKTEKTPLTIQNIKKYADGRILTGEQAQKLGFVDKLASLYTVKSDIRKMAKQKFSGVSKEIPIVSYGKASSINELLFGAVESFIPNKELKSYLPVGLNYPRQPLYMWE